MQDSAAVCMFTLSYNFAKGKSILWSFDTSEKLLVIASIRITLHVKAQYKNLEYFLLKDATKFA